MSDINISTAIAFITESIKTQVDIAQKVRGMQNADYILFDVNYHRTSRVRIGDYRVELDAMGRRAVLSAAGQKTLDVNQYYSIASAFSNDTSIVNGAVYLRALPKEAKSRSNLP